MHRRVLLLLALICATVCASAQVINIPQEKKIDSAMINPAAKRDSSFYPKKDSVVNVRSVKKAEEKPVVVKDSARLALERLSKVATRRSMIIPGWGQITNGRWWKVPIIYGGFVSLALAIDFNQRNYKELLRELQYNDRVKGDTSLTPEQMWLTPEFAKYDYNRIIDAKNFYRRNRDLSILVTGVLYAVNVIDAYVDATFFRFDVSKDLSLKVTPSIQPSYALSFSQLTATPTLKLKLSFNAPKYKRNQFN